MTEFQIVDACEAQLEAIETVERQCFSVPWTREMLRAQLGDGHIFLAAVDAAGELAGYVGLMFVLDEGYISNIAVSPAHRRRGAADALLRELERRAREKKLRFMTLEVRRGNAPAIALYEKHGFRRAGERKNYYTAPKEDAVLMTLELMR